MTFVIAALLAAPLTAQTAERTKETVSKAFVAEALANKNKRLSERVIGDITARLAGKEIVQETEPVTQEIELRSSDGLVSLHGIIVDYDEQLITVEASFGVVSVDKEGLECIGAACPLELRAASQSAAQDTSATTD